MKPASILIADDESGIRLMLRTALESDGYSVREACNGRQALDAIAEAAPDLMVLDMNMPVLDGTAVLEQLKSLASGKPRVIVLTAYGSIPTAVKATRLGAADFLEKPITPSELRQTVRGVLSEPEPPVLAHPQAAETGYQPVLDRIRKLMRLADFTTAESLLTTVAARRDLQTADYFNLLGVLYESQRKWRLAKKCYGKSMVANHGYEPAQANLRRIYELYTFAKSSQEVVLGDDRSAGAEQP